MKKLILLSLSFILFYSPLSFSSFEEQRLESTSYYKMFKYELSLAYTKFQGKQDWWTKIEPFRLYLGALPLANEDHLQKISDLGVTHILSIVEDFEIEDGWLNQPLKKEDWETRGIAVKQIHSVDFEAVKPEEIKEGIEYLHHLLSNEATVYVHCKAGRGRSATIVIAYLMQFQGISFEEAFTFVKELRPQINLNPQQRHAILDYFSESQNEENLSIPFTHDWMSEETLARLLKDTLFYVIEGGKISPNDRFFQYFSTWLPSIEISSTLERRNRYLRAYQGNQDLATAAAIEKNHGLLRQAKIMALNMIPFVGMPTSHSIALWHQLREITLIAALHGHDLHDPEVQMKILSCLIDGNLLKIPALTVDLIAREMIKKIVIQAGYQTLPIALPAHLIFNFFTNHSAKVATHAKNAFAGEHSLSIPIEEYWP